MAGAKTGTYLEVTAPIGLTLSVIAREEDADGDLGNYWRNSDTSWQVAAPSFADADIALTEGTGLAGNGYLAGTYRTPAVADWTSLTGKIRWWVCVTATEVSIGEGEFYTKAGVPVDDDVGTMVEDQADGGRTDLILDIIAADTTTDIPALIATAQADLDIVTGADGANLLSATQASIDAIEVDTGTTLQAELDGIQADTEDIQTQIGTAGAGLTAIPITGVVTGGTADSGTTLTMVDAARTEADTDYWVGSIILFTSGTIAGQSRVITGFTPASDTITFTPATTQAVATNTYEIRPHWESELQGEWLDGGRLDALLDSSVSSATVSPITIAPARTFYMHDSIDGTESRADLPESIFRGRLAAPPEN